MVYDVLNRYHSQAASRETIVTVAPSGADYTSIKAAIAGVTPTAGAPVRIYVRNGTYNEIQITGKDYLTIEGESRAGVVMVSDGLRTDVDPVSGQRYVDMAQAAKHGLAISHYMTIRNMTIRVNDVKYCVHMDNNVVFRAVFDNVLFQHSNGFPVGCGGWASQEMVFEDCVFQKLGDPENNGVEGSHGIFWHNWNDQAAATRLIMTDCASINCGFVELFELGSEYTDLCTFTRCASGDALRGVYVTVTDYYWNGGGQGKPNVPYCINILTVDGALALQYSAEDRVNLEDHVYAI